MCRIAGFVDKRGELIERDLKNMINCFAYRGSDGRGLYFLDGIGLAYTGLSMIDIKGGKQPLFDESKVYTILYDGKVHNFLEIKKELEDSGVKFITNSDTEVVLQAYIKFGINFLRKLEGMFSFCIYDKRNNRLLLARDRLGIKPLYYYHNKEKFLFASEIKSILSSGCVVPKINENDLASYLKLRHFHRNKAAFENIFQVSPGEYISIDINSLSIERSIYWDREIELMNKEYLQLSLKELVASLEEKLIDVLRHYLISDGPVGCFLSGGVDSSLIVAIASKIRKEQNGERISTFSMEVEDPRINESEYSRLVAKLYNTEHHPFKIKPNEFINILPDWISLMDDPVSDPSSLPLYLLAKLAKENGIEVIFSGDGGDEIFAGTDSYLRFRKILKLKKISKYLPFNKNLLILLRKLLPRYSASIKKISDEEIYFEGTADVFSIEEISKILKQNEDEIKRKLFYGQVIIDLNDMLFFDIEERMTNDALRKMDRITTLFSIEARFPYFNHKLVGYSGEIGRPFRLIPATHSD